MLDEHKTYQVVVGLCCVEHPLTKENTRLGTEAAWFT
jgi:hypothetical protein